MGAFSGQLTAHGGAAVARDVRGATLTPGASLAILDPNGIGVEVDLAHLDGLDAARFAESRVTSALLNFVAMSSDERFRPFLVVGAGVLRLRTTAFDGSSIGRTEVGWSAGGGMLYMLNDAVGVRGDARYFRHFEQHPDFTLAGDGVLDFWRTSVGVTFAWTLR